VNLVTQRDQEDKIVVVSQEYEIEMSVSYDLGNLLNTNLSRFKETRAHLFFRVLFDRNPSSVGYIYKMYDKRGAGIRCPSQVSDPSV
jgi:hypothetical protein